MAEVQYILCPNCHKPNLRRAKFCQHCAHDMVLNNDGPRYYITRVIKSGGQGSVFETIGDDGKVYAVKEMIDNFTNPKDRTEAIDRFEAEAKMLRRLSHPRIPRVYADFKDEGRQYLAMDFVRGEDLEEIIRKHPGGLPEPQVLEWADQICDVLDYLHNHKPEPIIFRDMKPSNVMIEPDGTVKLIDFGIAKVFQRAERGTQIGTPGYAPPEQYQGLATVESDIYALAATLHHMLTGRDPRDEPPFSFPPVYGLKPTISKRTSEALQKALQMNPDDRFQSIAEFRDALRPPAQARVPQKTTVLTPQPQAAVPVATPATPPPAAANSAVQPAVQARPAAPSVPLAGVPAQGMAPISTPAPPSVGIPPQAQPRQRGGFGRFLGGLLVFVVVLGLIGATLAFAFPNVIDQVLPGVISAPQATSTPVQRVYVLAGKFTLQDQEIIVPAGKTVLEAYQEAFIELARQDPKYGPDAIISPNAPPGFIGTPEKLGQDAQGTRYRATMEGMVYVPQQ